jgi:hypothetical protein
VAHRTAAAPAGAARTSAGGTEGGGKQLPRLAFQETLVVISRHSFHRCFLLEKLNPDFFRINRR